MLRKFIIIGDFNLNGIDWASGYTRNSIEREFLNGFEDLGLIQNINVANHNKGKTLDILLITSTKVEPNQKWHGLSVVAPYNQYLHCQHLFRTVQNSKHFHAQRQLIFHKSKISLDAYSNTIKLSHVNIHTKFMLNT